MEFRFLFMKSFGMWKRESRGAACGLPYQKCAQIAVPAIDGPVRWPGHGFLTSTIRPK